MRNLCIVLVLSGLLAANASAQQNKLSTTTVVVMGEGLAAGMADFSLKDVYQNYNFPAQIAQQLNTAFPQPLIEPPGMGSVPGFPALEVTLPTRGQTTVRELFPPDLFVFNLSVPGMTLAAAINSPPVAPLIQPNNPQQTMVNMILGYPALTLGPSVPLWTQLQYAQEMNPTLVLVELGYYEVLQAAVAGDPTMLPAVSTFQSNYAQVLTALKANSASVIVTTIPNPFDTAYFTSLTSATRLVGAPASTLEQLYNLQPTDLLTVPGLMAVGSQIFGGTTAALPAGSVVSAAVASQITSAVTALNGAITSAARQSGATVYDLNGFFSRLKNQGMLVGTRTLTASFQGGAYSLDGYYPGTTVHALIANEILALMNKTYGTSFQPVNATALLAADPAVQYVPSRVKHSNAQELSQVSPQAKSTTTGDLQ